MDLSQIFHDTHPAPDQQLDVWAALQMRVTAAIASDEHMAALREILAEEVAEERLDAVGVFFGLGLALAAIYEVAHRRLEAARAAGDLGQTLHLTDQITALEQVLSGNVAPLQMLDYVRQRRGQQRRGQA
jgi:hypothetical protein